MKSLSQLPTKNNQHLFYLYQENFYKKLSRCSKLRIDFCKNKTILDVGCGEGIDDIRFSKFAKKVVGIDIEEFPSWKTFQSNKIVFKKANAEKLPFKSNTFDIVFSKDMLHHTPNPQKALREIKRIVKKNGVVIILEGNRYNPISFIHMTKLKGHEHFPQKLFRKMILGNFLNAKFYTFESHFIPFFGSIFLSLIFKFEDTFEKIPFVSSIHSYNIAVIKKTT
ncbi:MAG TPA: class I SAM-dependent methyltransferase [Patescibacteria group bacterium]